MNLNKEAVMLAGLSEKELEAALDGRVKQVIRLKRVIANILKGTISNFAEMDIDTIIRDHIEGIPELYSPVAPYHWNPVAETQSTENRFPDECDVNFDVKCKIRLKPGETSDCFIIVDFEGQGRFHPGYSLARRGIYYDSRLLSEQIRVLRTKENEQEQYDKLSKVFSIWICFDPPKAYQNCITQISLHQKALFGTFLFPPEEVDMEEVIFILLGSEENEKCDNELLSFLNILFSKTLSVQERLQKLEALGYPLMEENFTEEVTNMTTAELCYYDSRFNAGHEAGSANERKNTSLRLFSIGWSVDDIVSQMGYSAGEVEAAYNDYMKTQENQP